MGASQVKEFHQDIVISRTISTFCNEQAIAAILLSATCIGNDGKSCPLYHGSFGPKLLSTTLPEFKQLLLNSNNITWTEMVDFGAKTAGSLVKEICDKLSSTKYSSRSFRKIFLYFSSSRFTSEQLATVKKFIKNHCQVLEEAQIAGLLPQDAFYNQEHDDEESYEDDCWFGADGIGMAGLSHLLEPDSDEDEDQATSLRKQKGHLGFLSNKSRTLTTLDVAINPISATAFTQISRLASLKKLSILGHSVSSSERDNTLITNLLGPNSKIRGLTFLDLSNFESIYDSDIKIIAESLGSTLRELVLENLSALTCGAMKPLAESMRVLKTLNLSGSHNMARGSNNNGVGFGLSELVKDSSDVKRTLRKLILRYWTSLPFEAVVSISKFEILERLDLAFVAGFTESHLKTLSQHEEEEPTLVGAEQQKQQQQQQQQPWCPTALCKTLKVFVVGSRIDERGRGAQLLSCFENLEEFRCGVFKLNQHAIMSEISKLRKLRVLECQFTPNVTQQALRHLCSNLVELEELTLNLILFDNQGCSDLIQVIVDEIAKCRNSFRKLKIYVSRRDQFEHDRIDFERFAKEIPWVKMEWN